MGRKRERVDCIPWPPALDVAGTHLTRLAQAADQPIGLVAASTAAVSSAVFRLGEAVRPPGARLRRAPVCGHLLHAVRAVAARAEPAHKPLAPADFALPRPRKGTSAADAEAAAALEAAALEDDSDGDGDDDGGGFRARAAVLAAKEKASKAAAAEEEEEAKRKAAAAGAGAAAGTGGEVAATGAAATAVPSPPQQEKAAAAADDDDGELIFELPSLDMPKEYPRAAAAAADNDGDEEGEEKDKEKDKEGGEGRPTSLLNPLRWGVPNAAFVPRSARFHPQPAPSGGGLTSAEVGVVRAAREARRSWADAAALVPGRSAPAVRKLYALATGESVGTGGMGGGGGGGGTHFSRGGPGSRPHPSPFMLKGGGGAFVPGGLQKKRKQQEQQQGQQQQRRGTSSPLFRAGSALPSLVAVEASLFDAGREKAVELSKPVGGGAGNGEDENGNGNGDGNTSPSSAALAPQNTVAEAHGADAAAGVVFFEACTVEDADDPSIVYEFDLTKGKRNDDGGDVPSSSSLLASKAHSACFNVGAVGSDGTPVLSWARLLNLYQLKDGTKWAETRVLVDADDFAAIVRGRKADSSSNAAAAASSSSQQQGGQRPSPFTPPSSDVTRLALERPAGRDADRELFLRGGRVHSRLQNVEGECWLYRCRPSRLPPPPAAAPSAAAAAAPPTEEAAKQVKRGRGRPPKAAAAAPPKPGAADAAAGLPLSLDASLPRGWRGDAWFWRHAFHPGSLEPVELESDDEAEEEVKAGGGKEGAGAETGGGENDDGDDKEDDDDDAPAPATAATTPGTSAGGAGDDEGEEGEGEDDEEGQPAKEKRAGSTGSGGGRKRR